MADSLSPYCSFLNRNDNTDHRRAKGLLNPRAREPKGTEEFLKRKLISDHGRFSSYKSQQREANRQDSRIIFNKHKGL